MSTPYDGKSETAGVPGVSGENSGGGTGVSGLSTKGAGVVGRSGPPPLIERIGPTEVRYGVSGYSTDGPAGVFGFGNISGSGVLGENGTGTGVTGKSDSGRGVWGISQSFIATVGDSTTGTGVYGHSRNGTGVIGKSDEDGDGVTGWSGNGSGVAGVSSRGAGVYGRSDSDGDGVTGWSDNGSGVAGVSSRGTGVYGRSDSDGDGVTGWSDNGSGVAGVSSRGTGVYGRSDFGDAGFFEGNVRVTGDICLGNADCAEDFDVADIADAMPGTVMVLGEDGTVRTSDQPYDTRVAGIVSGAGSLRPGIILDHAVPRPNRRPLGLAGKVYCKVDASYGAIAVGDLLTTSETRGHAMKASDRTRAFGAVLGKALKSLAQGTGLIPILVGLG